MKKLVLAISMAVCTLAGSGASAQNVMPQESSSRGEISTQDLQLLRKDLRAKRRELIAANLKLTESEAAAFWPVYDQYIKELISINDRKFALIKQYAETWGKLSNQDSLMFIRQWLDSDIETAQLRQKYVPIVAKVLNGQKTATFFQLDRRIAMMMELQVSSQMPLVDQQGQP